MDPFQWYYDYVLRGVELGLFNGMGDGTFEPGGTMTRAMIVTVLYRMAGSPAASASTSFSDVSAGQWYTQAVAWGTEQGIVLGMGDGTFGTNAMVQREQLVTFLYRYAGSCGIDTSARADLSAFPDAGRVSSYAREAMQWAVASGILNGSDGYLLPQGKATRAQCAKLVVSFYDKFLNKD